MTYYTKSDIIRLLIGEVLNENHQGIQGLIHEYIITQELLEDINVLGYCGESPAHIAIYKDDEEMLQILITAGANPNFKNQQGETLVHTAAKLGKLHLLKLLYETGLANLEITDDHRHRTALESLDDPFNEEILVAARLYRNWCSTDRDETNEIITGREQCRLYLQEKMELDRQMKIVHLTDEAISWAVQREQKRRLLLGESQENSIYLHGPYLSYPEVEGVCTFDEFDQRFFNKYRKGIHSLATKVFCEQHHANAMKLGLHHATTKLLNAKNS